MNPQREGLRQEALPIYTHIFIGDDAYIAPYGSAVVIAAALRMPPCKDICLLGKSFRNRAKNTAVGGSCV